MIANTRSAIPDFHSMVRSEPYVHGVADYHAGKWTDYLATWDQSVYETGRMVAAVTGKKAPTIVDYFHCCTLRIFPPSLNGVAPALEFSTDVRLSGRPISVIKPDDKIFNW